MVASSRLHVVAGSHTVESSTAYREWVLGVGASPSDLQHVSADTALSLCPIVYPGKRIERTFKRTASKFEPDFAAGSTINLPTITPEFIMRGTTYRAPILLCSDALTRFEGGRGGGNEFLVIAACSPATAPFQAIATLQTLNEHAVVFCNSADFGCSFIAITPAKESHEPFVDNKGTLPLAKGDCALLVADICPQQCFKKGGSVHVSESIRNVTLVPIIFGRSDNILRKMQDMEELLTTETEHGSASTATINQVRTLRDSLPSGTSGHRNLDLLLQYHNENILAPNHLTRCLIRIVVDDVSLAEHDAAAAHFALPRLGGVVAAVPEDKMDAFTAAVNGLRRIGSQAAYEKTASTFVPTTTVVGAARTSDVTPTYWDRDDDIQAIEKLIRSGDEAVLLISGPLGVGKQSVLARTLECSSPPLRSVCASVMQYGSVQSAFEDMCSKVDPSFESGTGLQPKELISRMLSSDSLPDCFVLTSLENALSPFGRIEDIHLVDYLTAWREENDSHNVPRLVMISNVKIARTPDSRKLYYEHELRALDSYWLAKIVYSIAGNILLRDGITFERTQEGCARILGLPIVAVSIANAILSESRASSLLDEAARLKHVEDVLSRILGKVSLTPLEHDILVLLATARQPIPPAVIAEAYGEPGVDALNLMIARGLVSGEQNPGVYLHQSIKSFFLLYRKDGARSLRAHDLLYEHYKRVISSGRDIPSEDLAEYAYHAQVLGRETTLSMTAARHGDVCAASGMRALDLGDMSKAVTFLGKAIALGVSQAKVYISLFHAFVQLKSFDKADELIDRVPAGAPFFGYTIRVMGEIAVRFRRKDLATRCYRKGIEVRPDDWGLITLLARIHDAERNYDQADREFERAKGLTTRNPKPHFFHARSLFYRGRPDKARDVLETGILLDARNPPIRQMLCQVYIELGEYDLAKTYLEGLCQEMPDDVHVTKLVAMLYRKAGKYAKAKEVFERIYERAHKDPIYLVNYGLLLSSIGKHEEASRAFQQAYRFNFNNIYVLLAWAENEMQKADEDLAQGYHDAARMAALHAKALLMNILELEPGHEDALRKLEHIADVHSLS